MKILTAVFRSWHLPYSWFGRDSGLVTEGLRSVGVDSRLVILKTPGMPADERFLPATREEFVSPEFWASQHADAVILQGGGEAATEAVASAIKKSGTKLIFRLDSDGVVAPQVDPFLAMWNLRWWLAYHHRHPATLRTLALTALKFAFPQRFGPGRISRRLACADFLLIESRVAAARLRRLLHQWGGAGLASKVVHLPIPVPGEWHFQQGDRKENLIVSVARWYDAQKDAPKLVRVLARVLPMHPEYRAVLIGDGDEFLRKLVARHAAHVADRIHVAGRLAHEEIPAYERRAKIFVCSSRAESMNISSAEALCCGCSVVGPAEIAAMQEYTASLSGTLAWTRRDLDFSDAVGAEIDAWKTGRRDPIAISGYFGNLLSPKTISQRIVDLVSSVGPNINSKGSAAKNLIIAV